MLNTDILREKYKRYWGEDFEEDGEFDEFGDLIDVDLANEIVEWSIQAADEIDRLRAAMKDFADFGTRHDTTPTIIANGGLHSASAQLYGHIRSMDEYVRNRAKQALEASK